MRVLFVASHNKGHFAPFILEQASSIEKAGLTVDFFGVEGHGTFGYFKSMPLLKSKISEFRPDVIHAHYGLSGLLANMQRQIPVVTTYHGCDINVFRLRLLSFLPLLLSGFDIVVSKQQYNKVHLLTKKIEIIPCGVDFEQFYPMSKDEAKTIMGLDKSKTYVLFSSAFYRPEKNSSLAIEAIKRIPNAELIELDGYTRNEVCLLMNAADVGLLTSIREGSPMFVKEMLACNRPVVSTPVGDVCDMLKGISGCYISTFDCDDIVSKLNMAMTRTNVSLTSDFIEKYDNRKIAEKIIKIYYLVTNKGK